MNVKQLLNEELQNIQEEVKLANGKKGIVVFDIDNTLLVAKGIYIYLKDKATNEIVRQLTPEQYDGMTREQRKEAEQGGKLIWDFIDFRTPGKVFSSIVLGKPKVPVLKLMDAHIRAGYEIGIVTARGCEQAVQDAIKGWLKTKNKNGGFEPIEDALLNRKNIRAINDDIKRQAKVYTGNKNEQLQQFLSEYDIVKFVDDSHEHIANAKTLAKQAKEDGKIFRVIDANKVKEKR